MARKLSVHEARVLFGTRQFDELFPEPGDSLEFELRLATAHPLIDDPVVKSQDDLFLPSDFSVDKWPF